MLLFRGRKVYTDNDRVYDFESRKFIGNLYVGSARDMFVQSPYKNKCGELTYIEE